MIAALRRSGPSVGTAPQEFVQRASIAAWGDEEHVERSARAVPAEARRCSPALASTGCASPGAAATLYLWVEVPGGEPSEAFAERLLERGIVVAPGSFFGPAGEGYVRIALVPTVEECRRGGRSSRRRCERRRTELRAAIEAALRPAATPGAGAVEETIAAARRGRGAGRGAGRRRLARERVGEEGDPRCTSGSREMEPVEVGPFEYHDKMPLKRDYERLRRPRRAARGRALRRRSSRRAS